MVQIKLGVGTSMFTTHTTTTVSVGPLSSIYVDTMKTSTQIIPVSLMMGVRDRWSVGAYSRFGNFIIDTLTNQPRNNRTISFGLQTDIYIVNTPVFNMYINGGAHFTMLTVFETYALVSKEYKYVGWGPIGNLGFNVFFIPVVGLNFNIGYEGQQLKLNERFINDNPQSMDIYEQKIKSNGLHISAGLNFMF